MSRVATRTAGLMAGLLLFTHSPVAGQAVDFLAAPAAAWSVRPDQPNRGDMPRVEARSEGLAITTGASAILYQPLVVPGPEFRIAWTVAQSDPQGRNEGYGIVLGGRELDGDEQAYSYFLIRQDGHALLKRRHGSATSLIRDWYQESSLNTWESRRPGALEIVNEIVVEVRHDSVTVYVNGALTLKVAAELVNTEGLVGLRVNHGLTLRLLRFMVEPI